MSEDNNFPRVWSKLKELDERLKILEEQLAVKAVPLKAQDITISMLKAGDKDVAMTSRISKIDPEKSGITTGKDGEEKQWRFQLFWLGDYTGQIPLQLWDKDIDEHSSLKPGDIVKMTGGYVTEYKSKLQMRISKNGSIELKEQHIL